MIQVQITQADCARAASEVEAALRSRDVESAITAAVVRFHARSQEELQAVLRKECASLRQWLANRYKDVQRTPRRSVD